MSSEQLTAPDTGEAATSRRSFLTAAGGSVCLCALAACGSGSTPAARSAAARTSTAPAAGASATASSSASSNTSSSGAARRSALAKLSDVPVGGSIVTKDAAGRAIVISQPSAGKVVAFSAVCTHAGCTVAPTGATLTCPCHGSVFDATTGKNTTGPAPTPLPRISVKVVDGSVVAA